MSASDRLRQAIEASPVDITTLARKLTELGVTGVEPRRRLVVTATSLPRELEVVTLQAPV